MRYALPLIWCVSREAQAKLLGMISDRDSIPPPVWHEWPEATLLSTPDIPVSGQLEVDYDREMRQAPSRSRG